MLAVKEVGEGISSSRGRWSFNDIDANKFESHVKKSVPGYEESHEYIQMLSDYFLSEGSTIYDIGCSTGNLIKKISDYNVEKPGINFIGIEPVTKFEPIFKQYVEHATKEHCFSFLNESIHDVDLQVCDMVTSFYSIQFIHPRYRQVIFDNIYNSLNWGGGFFIFEKVRAPDARFQDMISNAYIEYKQRIGYEDNQIIQKQLSLKGILEPFTTKANFDFLKRAGFKDIITLYKNLCFEGMLAVK